MSLIDTTARIEAGAKLLDLVKPGWVDHIDIEALDVALGNACVLGQLYGSYSMGREFLFGHGGEIVSALAAADHGFFAYAAIADITEEDGNHDDSDIAGEYTGLTDDWMQLIRERRIAA